MQFNQHPPGPSFLITSLQSETIADAVVTPTTARRHRLQASFDELEKLPFLQKYLDAFLKATGIPFMKLVPPEEIKFSGGFERGGNPFCSLVRSSQSGCGTCLQSQQKLLRNTARKMEPQHIHCFVGLNTFSIPVMDGAHHVATLVCGQVFLKRPSERDFEKMASKLSVGMSNDWAKKVRKTYFQTPTISLEKFIAIAALASDFAEHLPEKALRYSMSTSTPEHRAVSSAKKYIQTHLEESLSLDQVLRHVNVSRFYFCKIFKQCTGVTLTEYIARVRVDKAKTLLIEPSLRVSDIVFATGFGSIAQFNNVFKRLVGMSPTEYRVSKRNLALL